MHRRPRFLIAVAIVPFLFVSIVHATDYTWQGPAYGDLTDPSNWNPTGGPPNSASDNGYIAFGDPVNGNPAVLEEDYSIYQMFVGDKTGAVAENRLCISDHTLTVKQLFCAGMGAGNGTINQTGGTLVANGDVYLGNYADSGYSTAGLGKGVYNLSGSGTINATARDLYAGVNGPGSFNQSGAHTSATFSNVYLGYNALETGVSEGPGTYDLTQGTLTVGNQFFVGEYYNGTFTLKNSSTATVSSGMFMGLVSPLFTYTQNDTIGVQDNAALTITGGLTMSGNDGVTGTVNQSGGTVVVDQLISGNPGVESGTNFYNLTGGTLTLGAGDAEGKHTVAHFKISGDNTLVNTNQQNVPTLIGAATYDVRGGTVNVILGGEGIGLHKTETGTATLGQVNAYTGDTVVSGGKLIAADLTNSPNVTVENSGSELTANSIQTGTLTIGAGAKVTIAASPELTGAPKTVPEPSGMILLALAVLFFLARKVLFRRER
jgi:autotransporter-associated beta strand protein